MHTRENMQSPCKDREKGGNTPIGHGAAAFSSKSRHAAWMGIAIQGDFAQELRGNKKT